MLQEIFSFVVLGELSWDREVNRLANETQTDCFLCFLWIGTPKGYVSVDDFTIRFW